MNETGPVPTGLAEGPGADGAPRRPSPGRAALLSALIPGAGYLHARQLERAVLYWFAAIWLLLVGLALGVLGLLGRWVPRPLPRPPLGDWVADRGGLVFAVWATACLLLWAYGVWDSRRIAALIASGALEVRYSLRRQLVHLVGAQLLGLIPVVGWLIPPGLVREAAEAARAGRAPTREVVLRESAGHLRDWLLARTMFVLLWMGFGAWLVWWLLRGLGAPI